MASARRGESKVTRLIVMRKAGGGKVAVNPALVTHVRSATGAYTDIFFEGHQVAVDGTFEEVVARLAALHRRPATNERRAEAGEGHVDGDGLIFGQAGG
jgi:hypothetical protein